MSWSVYAVGRPSAVKEYLREKFATIKPNLASSKLEQDSASLSEKLIENRLDFLIQNEVPVAVKVLASGSEWTGLGVGATEFRCEVETIPGFVE